MMLWTVLFYVNPTTITIALLLSLLVAFFIAYYRPRMRLIITFASVIYFVILAAPIPSQGSIGDGSRMVIWDPTVSMQDISGPPDHPAEFGVMLDDGNAVRYSPNELTGAERQERATSNMETLFVHGSPDSELIVTDADGARVESPETLALVEEELEQQESYALQLEEEGIWGHGYGLALQERVVNTLLFVPIGILAYFAFSSWSLRLLFGPGLSLAVETAQWALASGRIADTGDLLVNSVGSALGTLFALTAIGACLVARSSGFPASESYRKVEAKQSGWPRRS